MKILLLVMVGVALSACGPRPKVCPMNILHYDPAPKAQVGAAVVVNQCSEKGPNTVSVMVYQAGAEMQVNNYLRVVAVKDKSEGKDLRKHGGPFTAFEWNPDGILEVFYDEKAELVNARTNVEGGAIKPMTVKYTPVHCYKEDEEISVTDRRKAVQCLPEKPRT